MPDLKKTDRRPVLPKRPDYPPPAEWFNISLRAHGGATLCYGKYRINDGFVRWHDWGPSVTSGTAHLLTLRAALEEMRHLRKRPKRECGVRVFSENKVVLTWVHFINSPFRPPRTRSLWVYRHWENKPGYRWRPSLQTRGDRREIRRTRPPEYKTLVLWIIRDLNRYGAVLAVPLSKSVLALRLKY